MNEIHCHTCGGFISDSAIISYRTPPTTGRVAEPRSALCDCAPPVLYGPPPGHMSSPGMQAVIRLSGARGN